MTKEKVKKLNKLNKKTKSLIFAGLTVLIVLGLSIFTQSLVYAQRILPHTAVGGVKISGLSKTAALNEIEQKTNQIKSLKFSYQDKSWELQLKDVGIEYDNQSSLDSAYVLGKTGSLGQRLSDQVKSFFKNQNLPLKYKIDETKLFTVIKSNIGGLVENEELETQLVVENSQPKIIVGKKGQRIENRDLQNQLNQFLSYPDKIKVIKVRVVESEPRVSVENAEKSKTEAQKIVFGSLKLKTADREFSLETNLISTWIRGKVIIVSDKDLSEPVYGLEADVEVEKVKAYVAAIAKEINREPVNAKVTMENGQLKVVSMSSNGIVLKEAETVTAIVENLLNRIKDVTVNEIGLLTEEKKPEITTEGATNLGIKELIGVAATDFSTSPDNRKHNIGVGAKALSGIIVKDGEEFSALKNLGKIDAAAGYLPELVINNNKLEADYGGGLCQNATTLFRAVMDAGLPISQRQNHSRRVAYYEKAIASVGVNIRFDNSYASIGNSLVGYDATVFIPQPDLKFKNDTGKAILVQEYTKGNVLYAEIYGTTDNRKSSITKAEVLSTKPMPATIYHDAPTLPKGTNKVISKGAAGAKTKFTYTITYGDGRQESQEFISNYRAIAPETQVGSQEVVQVPAEPIPAQ